MTTPTTTQTQTIKDRLFVLMETLLNDGTLIPKTYHPIIKNLVRGFLARADETQLRQQIKEMSETYIPWLLGEK